MLRDVDARLCLGVRSPTAANVCFLHAVLNAFFESLHEEWVVSCLRLQLLEGLSTGDVKSGSISLAPKLEELGRRIQFLGDKVETMGDLVIPLSFSRAHICQSCCYGGLIFPIFSNVQDFFQGLR